MTRGVYKREWLYPPLSLHRPFLIKSGNIENSVFSHSPAGIQQFLREVFNPLSGKPSPLGIFVDSCWWMRENGVLNVPWLYGERSVRGELRIQSFALIKLLGSPKQVQSNHYSSLYPEDVASIFVFNYNNPQFYSKALKSFSLILNRSHNIIGINILHDYSHLYFHLHRDLSNRA